MILHTLIIQLPFEPGQGGGGSGDSGNQPPLQWVKQSVSADDPTQLALGFVPTNVELVVAGGVLQCRGDDWGWTEGSAFVSLYETVPPNVQVAIAYR